MSTLLVDQFIFKKEQIRLLGSNNCMSSSVLVTQFSFALWLFQEQEWQLLHPLHRAFSSRHLTGS